MEMSDGTSIDTNRNTTGAGLMTTSAENEDLRINQTPVQAAAQTINSSTDNRKNSSTSVFLKPATPDRTAEGVSMR
jgi:sensor domain CHASE-containing protein